MSITVTLIDGRYTPLVVCDTCGQAIMRPTMAAVIHDMEGEVDREPGFAHKGPCHDVAEDRIREAGGHPGWCEFSTWIARLLHNCGMDEDETARGRDTAALLQELGI